jgi:DNA polymerase-3 subunit epsilon
MDDFVAIDFETANPKRVSACQIGYAKISNWQIEGTGCYLIKPIGGHAPFQTKIHGITERQTCDKPEFDGIYPLIRHLFEYPLGACRI